MVIKSKEALIESLEQGNTVKYVFFWGHQKSPKGVTKSCFSQWYEIDFVVDGITYHSAEQFMMAKKAQLFNDDDTLAKILASTHPGHAKKLGRCVLGFDESVWIAHRFDIVVEANRAKFSQNSELADFLLASNDRVLVEASPVDKVWGIGLAGDHQDAANPILWPGLNLLGFALMQVREELLGSVDM